MQETGGRGSKCAKSWRGARSPGSGTGAGPRMEAVTGSGTEEGGGGSGVAETEWGERGSGGLDLEGDAGGKELRSVGVAVTVTGWCGLCWGSSSCKALMKKSPPKRLMYPGPGPRP